MMLQKRIRELYFSPSGTTKKVTGRIAQGFGLEIVESDLLKEGAMEPFADTDCAVVGVPVFAGRVPDVCAQRLKQCKGMGAPAVAVAVYGNRDYDDALLELCDLLRDAGFKVVAAAAFVAQHSIFPVVASGRPDQADMEKLDAFRAECRRVLDAFSGTQEKEVQVKGNSPYCTPGSVPLKPTGDKKCNGCGACVRICPVHAISADDPKATDKDTCISCTACIAACPQHARAFHGAAYTVARGAFALKCAARKEPEWFF